MCGWCNINQPSVHLYCTSSMLQETPTKTTLCLLIILACCMVKEIWDSFQILMRLSFLTLFSLPIPVTGHTATGILPLPLHHAAQMFVTVTTPPAVEWWQLWERVTPVIWTMILSLYPHRPHHAASTYRQRRTMRAAHHLHTQNGVTLITSIHRPLLLAQTPHERLPPSFDCLQPTSVNTNCPYQEGGGHEAGYSVYSWKLLNEGGGYIAYILYRKGVGRERRLFIYFPKTVCCFVP